MSCVYAIHLIIVKSQFINFQGPFRGESENVCTPDTPIRGIGYTVQVDKCINFGNANSDSSSGSGSFNGSSNSFSSSDSSSSSFDLESIMVPVFSNFYLTYNIDTSFISIVQFTSNDTSCSNDTSDIINSNSYSSYECIPTPDFLALNLTTYSQLSVSKEPHYTSNTVVIEQYLENNENCSNNQDLLYSITYTSGFEIVDDLNNQTLTYYCKNNEAYLNSCTYNDGKCSDKIIESQCENNINIFCSSPTN